MNKLDKGHPVSNSTLFYSKIENQENFSTRLGSLYFEPPPLLGEGPS